MEEISKEDWDHATQGGDGGPWNCLLHGIKPRLHGKTPFLHRVIPLWDGVATSGKTDWSLTPRAFNGVYKETYEKGHGEEMPDWLPTVEFGRCVVADFAFGEDSAPYLIIAQEVEVNGYDCLAALELRFSAEIGWWTRHVWTDDGSFRAGRAVIEILRHYYKAGNLDEEWQGVAAHPPLLRYLPEMDGCDVHHVRIVHACIEDHVRDVLRRRWGTKKLRKALRPPNRFPQRCWEYVAQHRRRLKKAEEWRRQHAAEQEQ